MIGAVHEVCPPHMLGLPNRVAGFPGLIETRSLPTLTRSYPRHFTFYVARPTRSIRSSQPPAVKFAPANRSGYCRQVRPPNVKCLDDPVPRRSPLPNEFVNSLCYCSLLLCCLQKNAWQSRKDIVNLIADVVRIKASAEQFEDQRPACLRAWRRALPAISSTLSLDAQPIAFRKRGLT